MCDFPDLFGAYSLNRKAGGGGIPDVLPAYWAFKKMINFSLVENIRPNAAALYRGNGVLRLSCTDQGGRTYQQRITLKVNTNQKQPINNGLL